MSLSSKWLGHFPFKEEIRVRVPLGLPKINGQWN